MRTVQVVIGFQVEVGYQNTGFYILPEKANLLMNSDTLKLVEEMQECSGIGSGGTGDPVLF